MTPCWRRVTPGSIPPAPLTIPATLGSYSDPLGLSFPGCASSMIMTMPGSIDSTGFSVSKGSATSDPPRICRVLVAVLPTKCAAHPLVFVFSPNIPTPFGLLLLPHTPRPAPLVARFSPTTPFPSGACVVPYTPRPRPVFAVACPHTPIAPLLPEASPKTPYCAASPWTPVPFCLEPNTPRCPPAPYTPYPPVDVPYTPDD